MINNFTASEGAFLSKIDICESVAVRKAMTTNTVWWGCFDSYLGTSSFTRHGHKQLLYHGYKCQHNEKKQVLYYYKNMFLTSQTS